MHQPSVERRSQSWQHTTGRDLRTPIDVPLVNIPKFDHDNLVSYKIPDDPPLADWTSLQLRMANEYGR